MWLHEQALCTIVCDVLTKPAEEYLFYCKLWFGAGDLDRRKYSVGIFLLIFT